MDARTDKVRPGRGFSLVDDNPEQIKGEIDRTRAHLDETISAIGDKIAPRRLVNDFLEMFTGRSVVVKSDMDTPGGEYHATQQISGGDALRAVRNNPVPAALIGAGIAYYLFKRNSGSIRKSLGRSSSSDREVGGYGDREWLAPGASFEGDEGGHGGGIGQKASSAFGKVKDKMGDKAHDVGHRASGAMHSVGDKASSAMHSIGEKASDAVHSVGETAGDALHAVRDKAGDALHSAGSGARHLAGHVGSSISGVARSAGGSLSHAAHSARDRLSGGEGMGERTRDMAGSVRDTVEEHPLIFGGAALVVGLIAGLSAPSSRAERRIMGPIRDDLMDDLREGASQAKDVVGSTLREVGEAAGSAASSEALEGSGSMVERATSAVNAAIHTAGDKVREKIPGDADSGHDDQKSSDRPKMGGGQQSQPGQSAGQKPGQTPGKTPGQTPAQSTGQSSGSQSPKFGGPGGGSMGGSTGGSSGAGNLGANRNENKGNDQRGGNKPR